jgi:hypothetical protein
MMPRSTRPLRLAVVALQLAALVAAPALGKQPPQERAPAASAAGANAPSRIDIRRRPPDAEQQARERARRERIKAALPAWCAAYRAARPPLHRALAETDGSLRAAWGPWSRNVCYALRVELEAFSRRVARPPDPALAAVFDHAFALLGEATAACMEGLPTVTQLRLQPGLRELARLEAALAGCGVAAERLEPRPGF